MTGVHEVPMGTPAPMDDADIPAGTISLAECASCGRSEDVCRRLAASAQRECCPDCTHNVAQ
jgi:hypothetical protein